MPDLEIFTITLISNFHGANNMRNRAQRRNKTSGYRKYAGKMKDENSCNIASYTVLLRERVGDSVKRRVLFVHKLIYNVNYGICSSLPTNYVNIF